MTHISQLSLPKLKCGAIRGRDREDKGKNYNLDVMKVLALWPRLNPEEISLKISGSEHLDNQSREILYAIWGEDRRGYNLTGLSRRDYVELHEGEDTLDYPTSRLTLKGYLAVLMHANLGPKEHRTVLSNLPLDLSSIRVRPAPTYLIESYEVFQETYEFIKSLIPLRIVPHLWASEIVGKYSDTNLDRVSNRVVEAELRMVINELNEIIVKELHVKGIISSFMFDKDSSPIIEKMKSWIVSIERSKNSEELMHKRLIDPSKPLRYELYLKEKYYDPELKEKRHSFYMHREIKVGILTNQRTPKYNEIIIKTLFDHGPLNATELSKIVSATYDLKFKTVKSRLSNKEDGRLRKLHEKKYIAWEGFNKKYSRAKICLSTKGYFTVFYKLHTNFDKEDTVKKFKYDFKNVPNPEGVTKIPLGGIFYEIDIFYEYLKMLLPIKPTIYAWLIEMEKYYSHLDLDEISLETIESFLDKGASDVLLAINYILVEDKVLEPYFILDLKSYFRKLDDWMVNQDEEGIIRDLIQDRLASRSIMTNYEKNIMKTFSKFGLERESVS